MLNLTSLRIHLHVAEIALLFLSLSLSQVSATVALIKTYSFL